jgi:hypothetical protein
MAEHPVLSEELLRDVIARRGELDRQEEPFNDPRSARDELQRRLGRVGKAINESDWLETRRQLVTLLAQGCRMARDLSIDTAQDAVDRDDEQLGGK